MKYSMSSQRWLGPLVVLTCLWPAYAAYACSCMVFPTDLEKAMAMAYARADVVFLGDVTATRNTLLGLLRQREVTFSVRDHWKGSIPDTLLVRTNIGEIACGYDFEKGNSYLVFAYWDPLRKHLTTSFCDLNRVAATAGDAISVLNRLTNRKRGGGSGTD